MVGCLSILALAADSFGWFDSPIRTTWWVIPAGLALLFFAAAAIGLGRSGLRRIAAPLDDVLNASSRVADGDYTVRVEARGPEEVRSLGRAFNSMVERLQADDRQRRALLADLTHELRTPLTVMRGNLEGMLDGLYPLEETRLRSILEETQTLDRLVDDLRTLALAESGALKLKRDSLDLMQQVRESAAAFKSQADAGQVRIEIVPGHAAAMEVEADPQRLREILSNLLSNALHYSPAGGAIKVEVADSGPGPVRFAVVSVSDQGPGIAADDLPHIFDRFHKSADSGGMGLGLAIARHLVEAHGGSIRAESIPGLGTRISFTLPLQTLVK
jgi:signal transduction histidine kinase